MVKIFRLFMLVVVVATISVSADAQKKYYNDLREAMFSAGNLRGSSGPSNIVWLRGGSQYSFTKMNRLWIGIITVIRYL